jgi:AcrR family transcriptional regulator
MFPVNKFILHLPKIILQKMENVLDLYLRTIEELFLKRGVKSVTMDDISHELGISKKTLYKYFTNKADVIENVINYIMEQIAIKSEQFAKEEGNAIDVLLKVSRLSAEVAFRSNTVILYELKRYYPSQFLKFSEDKKNRIMQLIIQNMEQGVQEGLYRKEINIPILAELHFSKIELVNKLRLKYGEAFTPSDFFEVMFETHIRGIATRKGVGYFE